MTLLALIALILIAILVVYATSRRRSDDLGVGDTARIRSVPTRESALRRWVAAGLLSDDQAEAIERFETMRLASMPRPRVSPAIEGLAYVGGALLAVGAGMLVSRFWEAMGAAGHLSVIGVATIVSGVVGAVIGEAEPVARRLRGFLWMLCSIGSGAFAGLVVHDVFDRIGEPVALTTAATTAVVSGALWFLRDRPLQHVVTFVGLVVALGIGIAWADSTNPSAWIGLALWSFGALWAAASWRGLVPPAIIGFPLGVVLTLVGSAIVGGRYDWLAPVLGLVTAMAWTAIGIGVNEVLALAPGVAGIFVFLPWTLARFFGRSLGAPVIVMLSGVLLLAAVAVLWRRRSRGSRIGELWGGHFGHVAQP